ncbi:NEQ510 [Nanoarchaeum equitans Kin4-M]|uniref:NEQ510 n=1 Tax=Nanoarchaeum equitans (strain Kin4-M) TaxID=228908 RepID=Q74M63_NANEQ|nr:NEQ510 [Nanoarchaeum equitans Kin4-M]
MAYNTYIFLLLDLIVVIFPSLLLIPYYIQAFLLAKEDWYDRYRKIYLATNHLLYNGLTLLFLILSMGYPLLYLLVPIFLAFTIESLKDLINRDYEATIVFYLLRVSFIIVLLLFSMYYIILSPIALVFSYLSWKILEKSPNRQGNR